MKTKLLLDPRFRKAGDEYKTGIEAQVNALRKQCEEHTGAGKKIELPTDSYTSVSDLVK